MLSLELARSLSKSAILVYLFLQQSPNAPVGAIADGCDLSIASVYAALKVLSKKIDHDHDLHGHGDKRTVQKSRAGSRRQETPQEPQEAPSDPLVARMVAEGIQAGPAAKLVAQVGRERAELQLTYHAQRKAWGFQFKGHPAAGLYSAIRDNWAPPLPPPAPGLVESQAMKAAERRAIAEEAPAPSSEPAELPRTRATVLASIQTMKRSRNPAVRLKLYNDALAVGLDPAAFGLEPPKDTTKEAA